MDTASHYPALYAGYGAAVGLTLALSQLQGLRRPGMQPQPHARPAPLWPAVEPPRFHRPWLELGLSLLGVVFILLIGQLYVRGIRLPTGGNLGWLTESLNQIAIFSPVLIIAALRRHALSTFFINLDRAWLRLVFGIAVGALAVLAYGFTRFGADGPARVFSTFPGASNIPHVVQVLMEDLVIACLLVRLGAAVGSLRTAGIIVVILFVAAHIPALVAGGKLDTDTLLQRFADVGIGAIVLVGLLRTRDLLWFWPLHAMMDLTQFVPAPS